MFTFMCGGIVTGKEFYATWQQIICQRPTVNTTYMRPKSIPNGFAKSQNKLKYSSQTQKMAPNGRASREAKWVFATVASHLCLTLFICHFIFLLFYHSLSLPFFFLCSALCCQSSISVRRRNPSHIAAAIVAIGLRRREIKKDRARNQANRR
jgi:hypothetical protein